MGSPNLTEAKFLGGGGAKVLGSPDKGEHRKKGRTSHRVAQVMESPSHEAGQIM